MNARSITAAVVVVCAIASSASAQTKDAFVQALLDFTSAVEGAYGNEGPLVVASVAAMAKGLAEWDAVLGNMEAGLASDVGAVGPPAAARMHAALGAAYLERGRVEDALRELDVATKTDAAFGGAQVLRTLAFELANRSREAAEAQRLAWRIDRTDPVNAYRLARNELETGTSAETQEALTALGKAVEQLSQRGGAPGLPLMSVGLFDESSVVAPVFGRAAYANAYENLQRGKYAEALDEIRTRIAADSLITDAALQAPGVRTAVEALRSGQAVSAIAQLTAVAEQWSNSSEFHRVLGKAYWSARDYARSAEQLRMAIRLNQLDERSRLLLADVLIAAGDPLAAGETLEEAIRTLPQTGEGYWRLGRLRQALGDERGARQAFEKASSLTPLMGASVVHAAVGRLSHNQLDLDAAALAYKQRIDAVPSSPAAHADLADVYRAQDRLDHALAELLIAALLDPSYARAFAGIGQVHAAAGRDEEAARMLRKAVDLAPSQLEARYALSRALTRLGRTEEATRELQAFQQLQSKAIEEERRRFQDNLLKIEDALKDGREKGSGR